MVLLVAFTRHGGMTRFSSLAPDSGLGPAKRMAGSGGRAEAEASTSVFVTRDADSSTSTLHYLETLCCGLIWMASVEKRPSSAASVETQYRQAIPHLAHVAASVGCKALRSQVIRPNCLTCQRASFLSNCVPTVWNSSDYRGCIPQHQRSLRTYRGGSHSCRPPCLQKLCFFNDKSKLPKLEACRTPASTFACLWERLWGGHAIHGCFSSFGKLCFASICRSFPALCAMLHLSMKLVATLGRTSRLLGACSPPPSAVAPAHHHWHLLRDGK